MTYPILSLSTLYHIVAKDKLQLTTTGEDIWLGWVNNDGSDVVRVSLKHLNLLQRVVVEHS